MPAREQGSGTQFSGAFSASETQLVGNSFSTQSGNYQFLLQSAPPVAPPQPSICIPFRRDKRDFVKRDVLTDLVARCSQPAARVALVGLGGVGKSQLAIECCYQIHEADPQTWVFWVHASTAARFEDGYRQIAETLNIPGWNNSGADILGLVRTRLSGTQTEKWLLVIDNADDVSVIFGSKNNAKSSQPAQDLIKYIPTSQHGATLITTRDKDCARRLIEYEDDILDIGPLELREAELLMVNKLGGGQHAIEDVRCLALQLDKMPLAISQAAAYIKNKQYPRLSVGQYADSLKHSSSERNRLLQSATHDPRRDKDSSNAVILTWHTSFEHIRNVQESAIELLEIMSLYTRESIPQELVWQNYEGSVEAKMQSLANDIAVLRSFDLVAMNDDAVSFSMHGLVQYSTRQWIKFRSQTSDCERRCLRMLTSAFPSDELGYNLYTKSRKFLPHVEEVLNHISATTLVEFSQLFLRATFCASVFGQHELAETLARKRLHLSSDVTHQRENSEAQRILSIVLMARSKYEEAESLLMNVLSHLSPAGDEWYAERAYNTACDLAMSMEASGKAAEAHRLRLELLELCTRTLGEHHAATAQVLRRLAENSVRHRDYQSAEELMKRSVQILRYSYDTTDPRMLSAYRMLASIITRTGRLSEAEMLLRPLLDKQRSMFGLNHKEIILSMRDVATIRFQQSEAFQEGSINTLIECLELALQTQDAGRPVAISVLETIVGLLIKMPNKRDMSRAFEGLKIFLGSTTSATAQATFMLAVAVFNKGDHEEGIEMMKEALKLFNNATEPGLGPSIIKAATALCQMLDGMTDKARALQEAEQLFGLGHANTGRFVVHVARILYGEGRIQDAMAFLAPKVKTIAEKCGWQSKATTVVWGSLVFLMQCSEQRKKDEAYQEPAKTIRTIRSVPHLRCNIENTGDNCYHFTENQQGVAVPRPVRRWSNVETLSDVSFTLTKDGKHYCTLPRQSWVKQQVESKPYQQWTDAEVSRFLSGFEQSKAKGEVKVVAESSTVGMTCGTNQEPEEERRPKVDPRDHQKESLHDSRHGVLCEVCRLLLDVD